MKPVATFPAQDKYRFAAALLLAGAFLYTLARALLVPVFHDEAYTYFTYGQAPLPVVLHELGNNHILNTLLIKWSTWMFGMSELSLRLPALAGHLIFLAGVYRTLDLFLQKKAFIAGAAVLALNPFMLELFSAARGYSLGLGFLILALYYFLRSRESLCPGDLSRMFSFLALAVLSHLSFVFVYVPALIVVETAVLWRRVRSPGESRGAWGRALLRDYGFPVFLSGLLFLALLGPVLVQLKTGGFYHGGGNGFWVDTARSLVTASLYGRLAFPEGLWVFVYAALSVSVAMPGFFLVYKRRKFRELTRKEGMLAGCLLLLLGAAGTVVVLHGLLGTRYVVGRMAVFFLPLFWLTMMLFWSCWFDAAGRGVRLWLSRTAEMAGVLAVILFLTAMNFKNYSIAPEDHLSRQIIRVLENRWRNGSLGAQNISLGTHAVFVPSLYFYRQKNRVSWLTIVDITNDPVPCDVYYIFRRSARGVFQYDVARDIANISDATLRILASYPAEGTVLGLSPAAGL